MDSPDRKPLSGPPYRDFVQLITRLKKAKRYLEIGVHNGSTLALIECASIAVDPNFVFDRDVEGRKPALLLYEMTSDAFFAAHDPKALLGGAMDVVFLDGLHHFEVLLRDFINAERACAPESIILIDDCLPANAEMTERVHTPETRGEPRLRKWWTGDVWKLVPILREYRPDLTLVPVDVRPTGSVAVTGLDPASTRLSDAYDEIVARYMDEVLTPVSFEAHWAAAAPVSVVEAVPLLLPNIQVQKVGG